MSNSKYKRVLLKISGEGLCAPGKGGIDGVVLKRLAEEIKQVVDLGVELALVVGGGNLVRGSVIAKDSPIEETTGHYMGMLSTVINAVAVQDTLESLGAPTRVLSAIAIDKVCEPFIRRRAIRHLEKGRVVIFAGGTGNPYFTTDTAAALRAAEIHADVILKATQVDGVYDADPAIHKNATRYDHLGFEEAIQKNLQFMDQTAIQLCRENGLPIVVFDMSVPGNMQKVVVGEVVGTTVSDG